MSRFRKLRGVKLPYNRQALIRYTCLDYVRQPQDIRDKIIKLSQQAAGEHHAALLYLMTHDVTPQEVALHHHLDVSTLCRRRVKFFEMW